MDIINPPPPSSNIRVKNPNISEVKRNSQTASLLAVHSSIFPVSLIKSESLRKKNNVSVLDMVIIKDGNSEFGAHLRLSDLDRSRAVTFLKLLPNAQRVLSYHVI